MLRDDLARKVRFRLGNRTDLDFEIIQELQDVQSLYERGLRLPAMLATVQDFTISSYAGASLPDTFLKLRPLSPVQAIMNGRIVGFPQRVPYSLHTSAITGYGIVYDIVDKKIYVHPYTEPVTLRCFFYQGEPQLTSNIANKWTEHFHSLLAVEAAYRLLPYIDEPNLKRAVEETLAMERQGYADYLWREEYSDMHLTFQLGGHL